MASQVRREFVIGNFKPTHTEREKARRSAPKRKRANRPGNSEVHRAAIRKCPCCIPGCTVVGVEAHHLKHGPAKRERSAGRKATDRFLIPLCHEHHIYGVEVHGNNARTEPKWFRDNGIETPIELASALWAVSPNSSAMARIVLAHKFPGRGFDEPKLPREAESTND